MLIKMIDGGLENYADDHESYGGCPTCDYGSEYINEINIILTKHKIHVRTNQMYEYALSEGDMIRMFLSEYNDIQKMSEMEFADWFKEKLREIINDDEVIEEFEVTEVT